MSSALRFFRDELGISRTTATNEKDIIFDVGRSYSRRHGPRAVVQTLNARRARRACPSLALPSGTLGRVSDPDTFTVAEAAKVLTRTPKRVRQMLAEGKLTAIPGSEPARISAAAVLTLRQQLRTGSTPRPGPKPAAGTGLTADEVLAMVERLTAKALEASAEERARADAARDRAEELLREAVAAERLKADALAVEVASLRALLESAATATQERRSWWRR